MKRPQEHQSYGPGTFEGEPCYTRFASFWVSNGHGDFLDEDGKSNTLQLNGPFSLQEITDYESEAGDIMCLECLTDLLQATTILLTVSLVLK